MQDTAPREEMYHTDMSVGEILRRTRVHYGQSLADIERAIRIRASQIAAIETGDVEKLPGRVYAIGFVRSYSEYLGLDGDKMVHLFKVQAGKKTSSPELDFPVAAADSKMPALWVLAIALVMVIGGSLLWWNAQSHDRSIVTEIPAVPDSFKPSEDMTVSQGTENQGIPEIDGALSEDYGFNEGAVGALEKSIEERDAVPAAPVTGGSQATESENKGVLLNIKENSWVEIKDQEGNSIVSRVLQAGDQYFVPDRPDLFMSIGNAGGVELEIDGQRLAPLGGNGEIKRNLSLDADYLKKQYSGSSSQKDVEIPAQ